MQKLEEVSKRLPPALRRELRARYDAAKEARLATAISYVEDKVELAMLDNPGDNYWVRLRAYLQSIRRQLES